jgi:hypothetical protein
VKAALLMLSLSWAGISWSGDRVVPSSDPLTISHESAFTNYKSYRDAELENWKISNEKVMGSNHFRHQTPNNNTEASPVTPTDNNHQHMHH